jgi:hypothetical protein
MIFSLGHFAIFAPMQYFRTIMVRVFSSRKSSAKRLAPRVFAQKSFVDSIFGHFFCPFPENFSSLVQSKSKK